MMNWWREADKLIMRLSILPVALGSNFLCPQSRRGDQRLPMKVSG